MSPQAAKMKQAPSLSILQAPDKSFPQPMSLKAAPTSRNPAFSFLTIPAEIRALILEHLLIPPSNHLLFNIGRQQNANLGLQILLTCRQLLHEGLPLLYGKSIIEADFPIGRKDCLFQNIKPSSISLIRRLSLPADNDIDDIEELRDLVKGAKNLRLAALLRDYSTELAALQMLRLEFDQDFPPAWNEFDPYFEALRLWDEFERPDATEQTRADLCNIAMHFAFLWTVLRACKTVEECRPELRRNVYECIDGEEGTSWIVFTRLPLRVAVEIAGVTGVGTGLVSAPSIPANV